MEEFVARISKIPIPQRLLILVLVIITLFVVNYLVFISPINDDILASEGRIKTLDAQLVQKRAIARNLSRYRIEVERLKQRLNEALTLLPNEAEIPELLQKIAALVEQSDCEMTTFEPQGEVISGFYAKIPVKMAIRGNYHSIAVFFDKVSKLARIVNVNNIGLSEPKLVNQKVELKAEFTSTTFKFVDRPATAAPVGGGTAGGGFSKQPATPPPAKQP
jgi:type IV pilus assembly protein PilO